MKPLVIVDNDEEFKNLKHELELGEKSFETAMEFLKKNIEETRKNLVESKWNDIEEALKKRGLLPDDYDDSKFNLCFQDGVLYLVNKGESSSPDLSRFLRVLFGTPKE